MLVLESPPKSENSTVFFKSLKSLAISDFRDAKISGN